MTPPNPTAPRPAKGRLLAYWLFTAFLGYELVYGALWDLNLLNKGFAPGVLRHLGYPAYLLHILATCKIIAAVVVLLPGLRLVKEWAYAGIAILFFGAFSSHLLAGDGPGMSMWSAVFGIITILSRALRPPARRLYTRTL